MSARGLLTAALAAVALLAGAAFAPFAGAAATSKPVARIVALHGHALYAKRGSKLVALRKGTRLERGTWLVIGPHTSVTIRVLIGKKSKLAASTDLLYVSRYKSKRPRGRSVHKEISVLAGGAKLRPVIRVTNGSISSATK